MWAALENIVIEGMHSGLAGVVVIILLFWAVDRYLLIRDLKEQNAAMVTAFRENSAAITELSTLISQLCQRI